MGMFATLGRWQMRREKKHHANLAEEQLRIQREVEYLNRQKTVERDNKLLVLNDSEMMQHAINELQRRSQPKRKRGSYAPSQPLRKGGGYAAY